MTTSDGFLLAFCVFLPTLYLGSILGMIAQERFDADQAVADTPDFAWWKAVRKAHARKEISAQHHAAITHKGRKR
jgi:hypothetical protein